MKTFGLAGLSFLLCFFVLSSTNAAQEVGFTYPELVFMSLISAGFYLLLSAVGNIIKGK